VIHFRKSINKTITILYSPQVKSIMGFEIKTRHIIIPYAIGILWILCHPILSIVTGESKCRGIYTDEHQLDVKSFYTDPYPYNEIRRNGVVHVGGHGHGSLCDVLETLPSQYDVRKKNRAGVMVVNSMPSESGSSFNPYLSPYIKCHRQAKTNVKYSIVKVEPSQAPMMATESLILVVPFTSNWFQSVFHSSILTFLERMVMSPWLAKNIMVISPDTNSTSLNETISEFFKDVERMALPMTLTDAIIRQLVVLEVDTSTEYKRDEYVILSQGSRGIVPNLDLISAVRLSLQQNLGRQVPIVMHPYLNAVKWWEEWVRKNVALDQRWKVWAIDLGHMVAFMAAFWSPSPHTPALDQGIDSITIQARLRPNRDRRKVHSSIVATVACVEHLFRGLNSLSERLHHNVNQYLLPSSDKFVSHGEYILPCILIMLPLVMRVIKLLLHDLNGFDFEKGLCVVLCCAFLSISMLYCKEKMYTRDQMNFISIFVSSVAILFYMLVATMGVEKSQRTAKKVNEKQSIQLISCMLALYAHVPLALSHVSLFMISALIWVPVLSFVDYGKSTIMSRIPGGLMMLLWTLSLVPRFGINFLFWSRYACVIVSPLHFLVLMLSWM